MIEKNNFDFVRLVLSLVVVLAHIRDLTALSQIYNFTYFFNSDLAIKAFFSISGYLVFKSFITTNNKIDFAKKRIFRIYPAYISALLFCLVIGFFCSTLELKNFLFSLETLKYLIANLLLMNFIQPNLPNSLIGNPLQALNGSLWTIKIEVLFYFITPFFITFYKKTNVMVYLIAVIFISTLWTIYFKFYSDNNYNEQLLRQFPAQIPYFAIGGLIYLNKFIFRKIHYLTIISIISLFLFNNEIARIIIKPIFYSIITIYICTQMQLRINLTKGIDLSYGIYLFHFPIIQLLIFKGIFNFNIYLGVSLTIILSIFFSLLSWLYIEKLFIKKFNHQYKNLMHNKEK